MNRVTQKRNFICRVGQAQTRPLTRALAKPHTAMKKLRIVILGLARPDSKRSLNDGQIQNPSNPNGIVPLSNFVPRGFGFVHHSIAILYHEVPNLSLTIRNFFIAVTWCAQSTRSAGRSLLSPLLRSALGSAASAPNRQVRVSNRLRDTMNMLGE